MRCSPAPLLFDTTTQMKSKPARPQSLIAMFAVPKCWAFRKQLAVFVFALFAASAFAQSPACETKAVSKDGKPLTGAAKNSSIKKCQADIKAACEAKAVSDSGKKLGGAAKTSFMKKCESEAS